MTATTLEGEGGESSKDHVDGAAARSKTLSLGHLRPKKSRWLGPPVGEGLIGAIPEDTVEPEAIVSEKLVLSPLATHLPEQVVKSDHDKKFPHMKRFQAGVLFLDISGFTSLCEKFSMASKNGTDKLTKTLNGYMGRLAQELINYDGDIMKYAGDAILTLWPVDSILDIQPTLWHMYRCCMAIQKDFGKWETDVGVILKVKIGVAFGDVAVCFVGNNEFRHYVTNGLAVGNVNLAEKFCASGDVVFSPSAWPHISNLNIPHTLCGDGEHVYVHQLATYDAEIPREIAPYISKITFLKSDGRLLEGDSAKLSSSSCQIADLPNDTMMSTLDVSAGPKKSKKRRLSMVPATSDVPTGVTKNRVRMSLYEKVEENVSDALRLYITLPVLQKLDHNQPMAYLSEMRQVSILFINITMEPVIKMSKWQQCKLLQAAFNVIYPGAQSFHGCMNKIFMFDKGITFLVLFGLPSYKQENDCMHALQCAGRIKEQLDNIPGIECASIGVTTGSSFCGVVGHDCRHEYTVIGRKVNMAARLMMHYPDCVTCDHNTFYHSKLPKGDFIVQEAKQMKGLVEIGTIRQYVEGYNGEVEEDDIGETLKIPEFFFPILGRDKELEELKDILDAAKSGQEPYNNLRLIIYKGEAGIGRTRLLRAVMDVALRAKVDVVSTSLTMHDQKSSYYAVKSILMELLGLYATQSHQEREKAIRKKFTDQFILDNLCMLNDLLGVKFTVDDKHKHMDMSQWDQTLHDVLSRVTELMCKKSGFVVFAIDDSHFMDQESWDFIMDISKNPKVLFILSMKSRVGKMSWSKTTKDIISDPNLVKAVEIKGLANEFIAPLSCQFLKVTKVPKEVVQLLKRKSHGVPWWCEQIINQLHREHIIAVQKEMEDEPEKTGGLIIPEEEHFMPKYSNINLAEVSTILKGMGISLEKQKDANLTKMICVVTRKFNYQTVELPDTIKGIILARLDSMDPTDQMVVKCASILGVFFTQNILCSVLPKVSPRKLGSSMRRLLKQNIFICDKKRQLSLQRSDNSTDLENCNCKETLPDDAPDTDVYCQYLRFASPTVQETAYDMFVENTRQHLHRSAAIYFEQQAHRCHACGGGNFLSYVVHDAEHKPSQTDFTKDEASTTRISIFLRARHLPRRNRINSIVSTATDTADNEQFDLDKLKNVDVDCRCPQILHSVYPQLVRHWRAVADVGKTFYYLLEAAAAAIAVAEHLQALSYLKEAEQMLELVSNKKNPFTSDTDRQMEYEQFSRWDKARLQSLLGQAQYFLGQVDESIPHFLNAMKLMFNYQPTTRFRTALRLYNEKKVHWLHEHFPSKYIGTAKESRVKWLAEQAHCLSHLFLVNLARKNSRSAHLSVLQMVNISEKIDQCAHEVVVAYSSMLEYTKAFNAKGRLKKYERKVISRCEMVLQDSPNLQDLLMVIHVYITILVIRMTIGPINEAVAYGMRAASLCSILHDQESLLTLLPKLFLTLLEANKVDQAIDQLIRFRECNISHDMIAKTWYYTCCIELVLYTGLEMVPLSECRKFANTVTGANTIQISPVVALTASLALWNARTGNIPMASHWIVVCTEIKNEIENMCCYESISALLKIQEARLIILARALSHHLDENSNIMEAEIMNDFKQVKDTTHYTLKPRLCLLQSYYNLLKNNNFISNRHLSTGQSIAKELKMGIMGDWINACQKAWATPNHPATEWANKIQEPGGLPKAVVLGERQTHEIMFYILPLPHWLNKSETKNTIVGTQERV